MIQGDHYYEDDIRQGIWAEDESGELYYRDRKLPVEIAVIVIVAAVMLIFGRMALRLNIQIIEPIISQPVIESSMIQQPPIDVIPIEMEETKVEPLALPFPDASTIVAPYDNYIITQGAHGMSYGHMAIDIAGGKGAPIKSPISGAVSEQYIDAIGNTTIVIDNQQYQVTLLHGIYTVNIGDTIALGQVIGSESNQGNTRDMYGNSCRGRDCGYHTHLNIYDKTAGANINPLDFISD